MQTTPIDVYTLKSDSIHSFHSIECLPDGTKAHDAHDANGLTFQRVEAFRK